MSNSSWNVVEGNLASRVVLIIFDNDRPIVMSPIATNEKVTTTLGEAESALTQHNAARNESVGA
jgi:hypothetical protein